MSHPLATIVPRVGPILAVDPATVFSCGRQVNVKRDEALEILSKEGMLLVLCSLIDNMPYAVAEAAVRLLCREIDSSHSGY